MKFRKRGLVICAMLAVFALPGAPALAAAPGKPGIPRFSPPFKVKMDHVSYDVRPDLGFTIHVEERFELLNEVALRSLPSLVFSIGNLPTSLIDPHRKVTFEEVYLLKKNGKKYPAKQAAAPGNLPPGLFVNKYRFNFENAEVGDTLVFVANAVQDKPLVPGSFFMTEPPGFFPLMPVDDAVFSLRAPASLKLHFTLKGMPRVKPSRVGNMRVWVWKYKNNPGKGRLEQVMIHASTFPDMVTEMDAITRYNDTKPLPPMTAENRCQDIPGLPQDGLVAAHAYGGRLIFYFWGKPLELDRTMEGWNTPTCTFLDGSPRLGALISAVQELFSNMRPGDWGKAHARIQQLKREFPHKTFVAFFEAAYWLHYAWDARGGGYANSVTEEGNRLFQKRLAKAEQVMIDAKPYASSNPLWYNMMVNVQAAKGDVKGAMSTFFEGAQKFKDFYPLYLSMSLYLAPKWYGNWEAEDKLAEWSVNNTRAEQGETMYARIYWVQADDMAQDGIPVFAKGHASWPKMKQGFRDMMKHYPKSLWNLNNFAMFACKAGDKDTYLALRKQIGEQVMQDAWQGPTTLDLCEAKYGS